VENRAEDGEALLEKVRELVQRCFDALRDVCQSRVEVGRVSFD